MLPTRSAVLSAALVVSLGLTGSVLLAQPGGWGGGSHWDDGSRWDSGSQLTGRGPRSSVSRDGKIEVSRFRAEGEAALALAHGPITVTAMRADEAEGNDAAASLNAADAPHSATYEAAVEDQLVHSGYNTVGAAQTGQIAEVRVIRTEAEPPEAPRRPLSGEMSVGVSNRGSGLGLALQYDATKPRSALIATRLETRIRDQASGQVLWEGRAEIYTRQGDAKWSDQAIAGKLAAQLFGGFPVRTGEDRVSR